MESIIEINNLTFTYPGAYEPSLISADLTVDKGSFTAIIGGNGSGKTTLCKCINGLIPHFYHGDYEGEVRVHKNRILETPVAMTAKHVGYVYQDFEYQLVRATVLEDVAFAPLNYGYEDYREKAYGALETLGIGHLANRCIWELSGGQKHLVALAGVLALDPDILIIDEPVAQLDPVSAIKIYNKLKMLNEALGKTIIVIEHHTEFIATYCSDVVLMAGGSVLWHLPTSEALNRVEELKAHNIMPPQVTAIAWKLFPKENSYPLTPGGFEARYGDRLTFLQTSLDVPVKENNEAIITFKDVHHAFDTIDRSKKQVIRGIDLEVYRGENVALVGHNGSGKSTLLRMIASLLKPTEGQVSVDGIATRKITPEEMADKVSFIYQQPENMFIEDCIRADVAFYLNARRRKDFDAFVDEILVRYNLKELENHDGRMLSGGQQRRATLAIGTAMSPSIMLLDEPTASLDIVSRKDLTEALKAMKDVIETVIIATHDMQLAAQWADRILVLSKGQVIADGRPEEIFSMEKVLAEANLIPPQVTELSGRLRLQPTALSPDEFCDRVLGKEAVLWK